MTDHSRLTRRDALAGAMAAGMALAAAPAPAADIPAPAPAAPATPSTMASGVVFEDAEERLHPGPASAGIPGVMVSNGRDVALTDAQGRYALPVEPGQCVFVIKPSGYATPIHALTGLPYFAYVHLPDGSPEGFRFRGMPPTGALPASIDFPLRRAAEPARFDALLFTDPQPETLAELGYVRRDVVEQVAALRAGGLDAAFGITTGDLMFDDLSFYPQHNRMLGGIGVPWRSVPGNHDINVEAPDDAHSRDTWKRVFGPRHHAFQQGGATFILLDNVQYLGPDPAKPGGLGKYRGFFGAEQLAFVRAVLDHVPRESLVVYCFHIPLRTAVGSEPNTATVDARDFLGAIGTHPNGISFSGHTHTNEHHYLGAEDGFAGGEHHHRVLSAVSGSWWSGPFDVRGIPVALATDGCPNGFHILSVNGTDVSTRLVPAHDPQQSQVRLMLDSQVHRGGPEVLSEYPVGALLHGPITAEAAGSTRLLANLFDGGPRSVVALAIDGAPAAPMRRTARTDPFVEEVYARNAATKKPWVSPVKSTHLWQADLPADLGPGLHRLEVRATDEHGRPHGATMLLEVT